MRLPEWAGASDHLRMNIPLSARLRKQTGGPRDGALLRFSIGNALMAEGDTAEAVSEFRTAIEFDPHYSAAWKMLGTVLAQCGQVDAAIETWEQGATVANQRGDIQAAKEMLVFQRRLEKQRGS